MTRLDRWRRIEQAATDVAELRDQLIASQLAAAQVAISTAWNLMPPDTPRLLRERCKQIEGDIIDAADVLAENRIEAENEAES